MPCMVHFGGCKGGPTRFVANLIIAAVGFHGSFADYDHKVPQTPPSVPVPSLLSHSQLGEDSGLLEQSRVDRLRSGSVVPDCADGGEESFDLLADDYLGPFGIDVLSQE
uniref:Uncharacterized protein n=1 Tax=Parascaris equorum TaxID=6256 RepID=A0A914RPY5_PAREQ